MENATYALKMAAAVLIFVLAISIAILSFGQVRQTADAIMNYKDRETVYIDGDLYYKASGTERNVGIDSIIPVIFRAYLENYRVVFEGLDKPIYTLKIGSDKINKYSIDLETNMDSKNLNFRNVVLANDDQKSEFLCGILYGEFRTNDNSARQSFQSKYQVELPSKDYCLYNQLVNKLKNGYKIKEYLGVYYQDDTKQDDGQSIPEVNKTEKRIITYKIEK